jgi:uncharacterized protein GlcG (DUF336 family)
MSKKILNLTPVVTSLTLVQAQTIVAAALAAARSRALRPMAVVAVDRDGLVKSLAREDGATALRLEIAIGKACAAAGMGVNSRVLAERAAALPTFFSSIAATSTQAFVPQTGAVVIHSVSGEIIGAAGASGGTGDEDEEVVLAGILAAGLAHL